MKKFSAFIPSGVVFPFAGTVAPDGYLICDGSTVSRSIYANLFAVIGTGHGQGNGATTFHLPDYRGRFLRGSDNMGTGAAGRDPNAGTRTASNSGGSTGASVGSVQADAIQGHWHDVGGNFDAQNDIQAAPANRICATGQNNYNDAASATLISQKNVREPSSDGTNGTPRKSSESRPQNAAIIYIIKI